MLAAVISAIGLSALLVGLCWYLAKWAKSSSGKLREAIEDISDQKLQLKDHQIAISDLEEVLALKVKELQIAAAQLKVAYTQTNEALEQINELAKENPKVIGSAIRAQLKRLRALSEVPEVPTAPATTDGDD